MTENLQDEKRTLNEGIRPGQIIVVPDRLALQGGKANGETGHGQKRQRSHCLGQVGLEVLDGRMLGCAVVGGVGRVQSGLMPKSGRRFPSSALKLGLTASCRNQHER